MPRDTVVSIAVNRELSGPEHLNLLNQASYLWSGVSLTEWARRDYIHANPAEYIKGSHVLATTARMLRHMRIEVRDVDWERTFPDSDETPTR